MSDLVVTLCGDRRGKTPMHRISTVGNDDEGRRCLESLGLSVRPAKNGSASWRFETCAADYAAVMNTVARIREVMDVNVQQVARLGRTVDDGRSNSLPFIPAASVVAGMSMFLADGTYDTVASVEQIPVVTPVYDLDIEHTHNFIANGIVTHNSIYGWRGANVALILAFERDYPDAKVIKLEQNYRSTGNILEAAHAVVAKNRSRKEKKLWTEQGEGDLIHLFAAHSEREEAMWVAERILDAHTGKKRPWREFAVLYRTNAQSRVFEDIFISYKVPYRIVGGLRFYERKEIKDIIGYLRLILNPNDSVSVRRVINVPARGIGATSFGRIEEHASRNGLSLFQACEQVMEIEGVIPKTRGAIQGFVRLIHTLRDEAAELAVHDIVAKTMDASGYMEMLKKDKTPESQTRAENLMEMLTVTQEFEKQSADTSLTYFLEGVSLMSDIDAAPENEDAVVLMTLHSAKGLEFPVVFLVGLEEGIFPHSRSLNEEKELEEERRLAYVGITRAREVLFMTYAYARQVFGTAQANAVSRFVSEIPPHLLN
ncbi:MAG: ATP-binding domain-containing protein, partial [Proteobacteria bacterium]|nr:ATP-binding domain-containing protein [Pseudomonadota bacterium]